MRQVDDITELRLRIVRLEAENDFLRAEIRAYQMGVHESTERIREICRTD